MQKNLHFPIFIAKIGPNRVVQERTKWSKIRGLTVLCLKNWYLNWNCIVKGKRIGVGTDPNKVALLISGQLKLFILNLQLFSDNTRSKIIPYNPSFIPYNKISLMGIVPFNPV